MLVSIQAQTCTNLDKKKFPRCPVCITNLHLDAWIGPEYRPDTTKSLRLPTAALYDSEARGSIRLLCIATLTGPCNQLG